MPTPDASLSSPPAWPPALGVCGWSKSGKTALLEQLAQDLHEGGLRVAVAKRAQHLDLDKPGKDSDRLFHAGADVVVHSGEQALMRRHGQALDLNAWLRHAGRDYDLVLVEGHKGADTPKVWVADEAGGQPPEDADGVVAVLAGAERSAQRLKEIADAFLADFHRRLPVCAAILVGGRSGRMGQHKSLLRVDGEPLLVRIARSVEGMAERVVLVGRAPLPEEAESLSRLEDVADIGGPLGGVLSAMRWRPDVRWLVLSCDLPHIRSEAVRWLLDQCGPGRWAVAPRSRGSESVETLFAVYDPPTLALLEDGVRRGDRSVRYILRARFHSPNLPEHLSDAWTNTNTPEEWQQATS